MQVCKVYPITALKSNKWPRSGCKCVSAPHASVSPPFSVQSGGGGGRRVYTTNNTVVHNKCWQTDVHIRISRRELQITALAARARGARRVVSKTPSRQGEFINRTVGYVASREIRRERTASVKNRTEVHCFFMLCFGGGSICAFSGLAIMMLHENSKTHTAWNCERK